MRWLLVVGSSLLLAACSANTVQSQRLKDGSWSITCELPMDECVHAIRETCPNQRYRILEGTSETRVRDVPPYEQKYHTSRLRLACSNDGANVLLSLDAAKPAAGQGQSAVAATCTRGETRECVGAGACKGGQACLPDGTGYGACDCGAAALAPAAPSASTTDAPPPSTLAPPPTSIAPPGAPAPPTTIAPPGAPSPPAAP